MSNLNQFIERITADIGIALPSKWKLLADVQVAQRFLTRINQFFFQTYSGIGNTELDGEEYQYFSEFHKFWEKHHKEILNPRINRENARKAAECLSLAVKKYGKGILSINHQTHGLPSAAIAQVRFFTANQDFRKPPKDPYGAYLKDATRFDATEISENPEEFLRFIGSTRLSQSDKRFDFARNAARFLTKYGITAFQIASTFKNDAVVIREALMSFPNMGYGSKKANMFVRDMVELKVWPNITNYDKIDVASDINTMKLALRMRILETDIPLLSSFLDIFCYQYSCMDEMSASSWRAVWEEWREVDASTALSSPCELDFLLYRIGREYCKDNLVEYKCEHGHVFFNFGAQARRCRICKQNKQRSEALPQRWMLPCQINSSELPREDGILMLKKANLLRVFNGTCILEGTCQPKSPDFRILDPPKSISIKGQTSWTNSTADRERGGGGMMG
jgi:hypothetical protein